MKIKKDDGNYKIGTRDLFSVVIIFKILLEEKDFKEFYFSLIKNIYSLKRGLKTISIDKVLFEMGFPKNYKHLMDL